MGQGKQTYKLPEGWIWTTIRDIGVVQSEETIFSFLKEFSHDTSFVRKRLSDNFKYLGWVENPNIIEEVEFKLKSFLNSEYLFELIYTENYRSKSDKVLLYKENGLVTILNIILSEKMVSGILISI